MRHGNGRLAFESSPCSRDCSIVEVPAPESFVGRTLKPLELRSRLGFTLIAIKRQAEGGAGVIFANASSVPRIVPTWSRRLSLSQRRRRARRRLT
jgi:hypothetical protein